MIDENGMKQCTKCHEWKPLARFFPNVKYKDGYQGWCKDCLSRNTMERRKSTPQNIERTRENGRRWRENNPERFRQLVDKWQRNNPDKVRASRRKSYYNTSPEQRQLRSRKWRQANPEKVRLLSLITTAHYNARKNGAEGTFTAREWLDLCDYYGNKCLACGEQEPLTIDHVIPLSREGSNFIANIQPLCLSCNSKKHTQTTDYRPSVPAWAS